MALRDFFISLSENQTLSNAAQQYGVKLGAGSVVAGTSIQEMMENIKQLNLQGISCTVDNLSEFVSDEAEATKAKEEILRMIEAIHAEGVEAHVSLKPSQLGLDIDIDFCYDNVREIVERANEYGIFVNFDMENHNRLQPTFDMLEELLKSFDNVGTVIQAYFHRAKSDIEQFKDTRLRIVKGAYKESEEIAFQDKLDVDVNFLELIEYHLSHGHFTSIATHDHNIIKHVKYFVEKYNIPKEKFEFQMLYGFRKDLQLELAHEGYQVCVYVPYGKDWYGYFMRRLAERPQNLNLVTKQVFTKKTNTVLAVAAGAFILGRLTKKK
ncbi:proline dehydrogenase [Lysinibacillus sp. 2017]|uniref:proline dehydrogenase family protein n=1 Tax=unclassified Lysinibacillus TaxID=2636778 RepID=UPI000D52880A|nr:MULTISPECIES: proline dehydrogenase family protein [unclassified Lysinibacillus]AWE08868.1 proline dehydrogenase [Lysinibacillus sp. 2017]TGN34747.1 proline dehydrogenase [Lysinibacillus sp. S2017]